jgi:hypothetical protein
MVKDSTTSEISNLFQELIVSKIKDEIEILKKEIECVKEINTSFDDKVEKLPKSSSIKQIVETDKEEVIALINKEIANNSNSEKYLKDIVAYLKKQYAFSDKRTLCLVLDEIQQENIQVFDELTPIKNFVDSNNIENNLNSLTDYVKEQCAFDEYESLCQFLEHFSETTEEKIANIIANQESFVKKYDSIETILNQYKNCILAQIKANTESLGSIQEQLIKNQDAIKSNSNGLAKIICKSNDEIEKLDTIQKSIDSISKNTESANTLLNCVMDNIGSEFEILELLRFITSSIDNTGENSEGEWTIKNNLLDINKKIEEIVEKNALQDEMISSFTEKYEHLEKSRNPMIKILIVGNFISVIGVIVLIIMQIFYVLL